MRSERCARALRSWIVISHSASRKARFQLLPANANRRSRSFATRSARLRERCALAATIRSRGRRRHEGRTSRPSSSIYVAFRGRYLPATYLPDLSALLNVPRKILSERGTRVWKRAIAPRRWKAVPKFRQAWNSALSRGSGKPPGESWAGSGLHGELRKMDVVRRM